MLLMSETAVLDPGFDRLDRWLATSNGVETWDASDSGDGDHVEPAPAPAVQRSLYRERFAAFRLALADGF